MQHRPEIDGLRAVAVLPVILFHAGAEVFSGGYVGVDVFFVISGYLITSILLEDLRMNRFSILRFYERRARRILPALGLVILCCLPFAWLWMVPSDLRNFGQAVVATALFASNIHFWRESGYFEPDADKNVLLHTWSLAVEEQYYILFPLLLLLLYRFRHQAMLPAMAGMALASLAFSEWGWRNAPDANFYLPFSRVWELFAGSICALILARRTLHGREALAAAGLALIFFAVFAFDEATPFPSIYALAPVVGTALIILFARTDTYTARLLSQPLPVMIGLISYSAYLWHQPIFAFARIRSVYPPTLTHMLALALLSLTLGYLSWRFIERPFRGPRPVPRHRRTVFAASAVLLGCLVAVGMSFHLTSGMPQRAVAMLQPPMIDKHAEIFKSNSLSRDKGRQARDVAAFLTAGEAPRLLILGDSHAVDIYNALSLNAEQLPGAAFLMRRLNLDCGAGSDALAPAEKYYRCAQILAEGDSEIVAAATHIVYSMRVHRYEDPFALLEGYTRFFKESGKKQLLMSNTVEYRSEAPDMIRISLHEAGGEYSRDKTDHMFFQQIDPAIVTLNDRLEQFAAQKLDVPFFSKFSFICDDENQSCVSATDSDRAIYYDYGHWTLDGAAYLGRRMLNQGLTNLF